MSQIVTLYTSHLQPARGLWKHIAYLSGMTVIFLTLSALAIYYSLGYEINWQTRKIQQTGNLYVNIRNNVPAAIYVDGQLEPSSRPLTLSHVFPGQYALRVNAEGYQPFQELIRVDKNTVSAVHNLILIKIIPEEVSISPDWLPILPTTPDNRAIVRNANELWVDNKFVTRTSQDILQARFYVDGRHVIYQEAGAIWMLDTESVTTVLLLSGIGNSVLPFAFERSGQILAYQTNGGPAKAISLY